MSRLLAELDHTRGRRRTRSPGDLGRRLTAGFLAVVLTAVVALSFAHKQFGVSLTAHGLRRAAPLGTPPAVATGVGSFEFMRTQPHSGRPVAYDPCKAIHYVVNETLAPAGGRRLLDDAVRTISSATGLRFVYDGPTDDLPRQTLPDLGHRRPPVLVAWTTPEVVPDLEGRVAGVGGSAAVTADDTGDREYVTGKVALDSAQLVEVLARPDGAAQVRAIITHELGHLVGLDHVDDRGELMYRFNVGRTSLGPGDREGLAALGSGRCFH